MNDNLNFAQYFLAEEEWTNKLDIMYYLRKRTGIYYNYTVVFKTLLAKLFYEYINVYKPELVDDINENYLISARLMCDTMKIENSTDIKEIKSYAKRSALYAETLGFDDEFTRLCESVNRYTIKENRTIESDILEMVDQYGGMVLNRPERIGFAPDEAVILIKYRNLKDKNNQVEDLFFNFIRYLDILNIAKIVNDRFNSSDTLVEALAIAKEQYEYIMEKTENFTKEVKENPISYENEIQPVDVSLIIDDYKKRNRLTANETPDIDIYETPYTDSLL